MVQDGPSTAPSTALRTLRFRLSDALSTLELSLLFLLAAVIGVVVFRVIHLPPMLGYLVVGILIGPHALGFAADLDGTRHLAEFGVVFLMFSIGLEFSLPKLYAMKRIVFGFGFAQVALTIVVAIAGGWAATRWSKTRCSSRTCSPSRSPTGWRCKAWARRG